MRLILYIALLFSFAPTSGQMLLNPYMVEASSGPTYDADAVAIIAAIQTTGVSLTGTQQDAIDRFVKNAKGVGPENSGGYNFWSTDAAYYGFVGGTEAAHAINWRNPGTYDLLFVSSPTHNANGVAWNGTSQYANTQLIPSAALSLNSTHIAYYSRTNVAANVTDIGAQDATSLGIAMRSRDAAGRIVGRVNNTTQSVIATGITNSVGFFELSRTASNATKAYLNGTQQGSTITTASTSLLSTQPIYIGANNGNGIANTFTSRACSFVSIGGGHTDAQAALWNTIVERLQDDLGRGLQ